MKKYLIIMYHNNEVQCTFAMVAPECNIAKFIIELRRMHPKSTIQLKLHP